MRRTVTTTLLIAFLTALFPALLPAEGPLNSRLRSIAETGAGERAIWGVNAMNLESGEVLSDWNADKLLIPASTRKLVSTAIASREFSPGYTFSSELWAPELSETGEARGDLVFRASGDPSWTPRLMGGRSGTTILRELARKAKENGLRRVTGDFIVEASAFSDSAPLAPGWSWDDLDKSYGARASALSVNHNLVGLELVPAAPGQPVSYDWAAPVEGITVVNESETGGAGTVPTLNAIRALGGATVRLTGRLPADAQPSSRAIPLELPAEAWGKLLHRYLIGEGIAIDGRFRITTERQPREKIVASVSGAPLRAMMEVCNEESDNFLAESLFLLAAAEHYGRGSYENAGRLEDDFWDDLNVSSGAYRGRDGSGLSRENLITPGALVELLSAQSEVDWWVESLPVSGRSGTLRYRLSRDGMADRVRAKTGTLNGVSGLAGYVTTNRGDTVAFAIIANNYTARTASIRALIDQMVVELAR